MSGIRNIIRTLLRRADLKFAGPCLRTAVKPKWLMWVIQASCRLGKGQRVAHEPSTPHAR